MLITGGSGSKKTNVLLNLIKEQDSDSLIYKIHLYAEDLNERNYQFLIKKHEDVGIKCLNDSKAFIEYSQCLDDVYNSINDYDNQEKKIVIVFDDVIVDIMTNKKFNP